MNMNFDKIYFEPQVLDYPLGTHLLEKYRSIPKTAIESHNRIPQLSAQENKTFPSLKRNLIIGVRKTHKYTENHKVSDFLVPYTSSGCRAMCLYCYLVCNYNKCSYLRLFVNREEMMTRLLGTDKKTQGDCTFEIGSNSDLILENTITDNLVWTIERFANEGIGKLTFPTKFDMVEPILTLEHQGKIIPRMSVNPQEIISRVELGTSGLDSRIRALNSLAQADYPVGLLIAPVILMHDWQAMYSHLIEKLADELCDKVKRTGFIEIILMTYSFVQNAINTDAFPASPQIFDRNLMTGRGRGKYCYKPQIREQAEEFFKSKLKSSLPDMKIIYIS